VAHAEPVLLDTDTLSELSRGNVTIQARARSYLAAFGRLTISSVTVFERLRGYRQALLAGKPFHTQFQAFQALVHNCVVLPFDRDAADVSASIWAACTRSQRHQLGDILIAGIAVARQIPLVTRNTRDFEALSKAAAVHLRLSDWSTGAKRVTR
jgi:predicted nucleic acid-binding protein